MLKDNIVLANVLNDAKLSKEEKLNLMEEYMTRQEILSKYTIKQLGGNDKRYYVYLDGKKIKFTHKKDLEDYIVNHHHNSNKATLNSIYDDYIKARMLGKAPGTWKKDIVNYNTFIKDSNLANINLEDLSYDDGVNWYYYCDSIYLKKHNESMKKKYFDNIKATLNSMMTYAKRLKLINENPFLELEIHKDKFTPKIRKSDDITIYSDEERLAFKKESYRLAHESNEAKYLAPILLFNLGPRDGELMALKWCDIIDSNHIHIQSEFIEDYDENGKFKGMKYVNHCKTIAGDRVLLLNSECKKVLKEVKKLNLKQGYPISNDDFIFQREYRGQVTPLTPRTMYSLIEKICKAIGMQEVKSAHDMRRTCFTNLFYAGMPIKDIQAYAGHEDIRMTEAYIKKKPSKDENVYLEAII